VLLAPDQAHDFLAQRYGQNTPNVRLVRIPGLRFLYTRGRLNLAYSIYTGLKFLGRLRRVVADVQQLMSQERPDLAICDFEPVLPRAARRWGVPVLAINHQNFAVSYDLSTLPRSLRWYAAWIALIVRAYHTHQVATVVSAFFRPALRKGHTQVIQVGPLLRPELRQITARDDGFLLSYLRPCTPPRVLQALKDLGRQIRVYGCGPRPADGPLIFRPIDERTYVEDLAGCTAYVGAAGNQSLGELLHFGKPVLTIPELNHHEQLINSHFIRHMGVGDFVPLPRFQTADLARFLDGVDAYREALETYQNRIDGTADTLAVIHRHLPHVVELPPPAATLKAG
jgi:uncharacterized protein (TIGR00661 family)